MTLRISEMATASAFNGSELVEVSQLSATVRRASTSLSFSAVDNSINDATFGLVSAGFAAGDTVQIVGSALNNHNSVTITNVTSGKMTTGAILSTEAAGAAVTVARWDTRSADTEPPLTVGVAATASYTVGLANWNEIKPITGSGAVVVTLPTNAVNPLPIGYCHAVRPLEAFSGSCTWAGTGIEEPAGGSLVTPASGTSAALKIGTDAWVIVGVTDAP